ncbi:hypothetical protein [Flavobacterium sp. HJJ]|uniref:hypothetical protein n=1 Tax=Flavobacterium sp. HJJ TaxID=2783792 RepID=UPI001889F654|nr:hypothetical protein [Flavobacterium sp. HJJ]MBF4471439.1 hypothetical protein [Flavobacterium sp. HJJ]
MFEFNYYLVIVLMNDNGISYPNFIVCAKTKTGFVRIENLKEYLKDGKSGLSNELYDFDNSFIKVTENWQNQIRIGIN